MQLKSNKSGKDFLTSETGNETLSHLNTILGFPYKYITSAVKCTDSQPPRYDSIILSCLHRHLRYQNRLVVMLYKSNAIVIQRAPKGDKDVAERLEALMVMRFLVEEV